MAKEESHENYEQESEEMMGEKYIVCKDSYYQPLNKCITYMEPLLIDYSILTSSSSPQKAKEELHKFKSALSSWGCFQLINHDIPTTLLDEVQEVSRQFFGLPMEEKQKYAMLPNNGTSGHGYQVGNNISPSATTKVLDWNEGFSLALFPEDRIKLEFWPEFPPNFKDVIHEYTTRVTTIFEALFTCIVQSLNVDEDNFAKQYGHNKEINLRLNFYPKFDGLKQVLGLKPHADFSTITMLLQDEEGLQVLKDEQWFMVPIIPHALFVNLGDPLEFTFFVRISSPPLKRILLSPLNRISRSPLKRSSRSSLNRTFSPIEAATELLNHGISSFLLNQIREVWKEFISLPLEVKQIHCRTLDWYEGYGGDKVSEDQKYNWNDRLRFKVHPLDQRNYYIWPEFLPNFRETLEGYTMEVTRVLEMILKATAKSLNLEENSFLSACGGKEGIHMFTRFNYYPPCPSPEHVLGVKPHSDGSAVTILLQDNEVEGLLVEKDDQWFKVPIVPDALFINVGDQLEIMSNGTLKSVVHKVVIDKERGRTSVAMFCAPHPDKDIGPLSELIDKERPQLYNTVKNYFGDLFFQYYPKGERSISSVKL